jgi:FKBP-type peptidyl-prolyl cis-trans isomerase
VRERTLAALCLTWLAACSSSPPEQQPVPEPTRPQSTVQEPAAQEAQEPVPTDAKSRGEQFLAKNAQEPGVVTLPSGLQYQVLREGSGKSPGPTDTVTVHYRGTLIDGKEFDSSYSRGEPISFPLNGVIKGWTEGLQHMKEGSTHKLFIPSELGYGARGSGPDIGPHEALIFEVELIKVGQ